MQTANVLHMVFGLLGIAMAFGHVYLGTLGVRGAYQAMRTGYVDETWAKEHHGYWYEDVKAGRSRQKFATDVPEETRAQVLGVIQHS
jgi:formate dehydrogenase subunit gamma